MRRCPEARLLPDLTVREHQELFTAAGFVDVAVRVERGKRLDLRRGAEARKVGLLSTTQAQPEETAWTTSS
jgi:hypothetical protein